MRRSLFEIEALTRKAVVGAGFDHGLAEDTGKAAVWLAVRGHDCAAAVLHALDRRKSGPVRLEYDGDTPVFRDCHTVACGPSALDLFIAGECGTSLRLKALDAPLLLAGLAGVAAGRHGGAFRMDFAGTASWQITGDALTMSDERPGANRDVVLSRHAQGQPAPGLPTRGAGVDADGWRKIEALAARMLVPESALSRARGAGAGAIDND